MTAPHRPDPAPVLAKLKDFQRETVEHVFRRLYTDTDRTNRFLIADEVGLGKTLVAKGIVARAIDHLWDSTERIDIVYICSNTDIARQNINRLNVDPDNQFTLASRITLLPAKLHDLQGRRLNFVSLTPGTSFELKSHLGLQDERALLYRLLEQIWQLKGTASLNVLQGNADADNFRALVRSYRDDAEIDASIAEAFARTLGDSVNEARQEQRPDIRARFDDLCDRFARVRKHIPPEDRELRKDLVGELRELLAVTCLRSLEPDLIILDEFQRFKHLLDGRDPASGLARRLFEYEDARILLLSATPYKMYTLSDESAEDNHYEDFVRTLAFLQKDKARIVAFEQLLQEYRRELFRLPDGSRVRLKELIRGIEAELRRVMVRTERLAVTQDRDGMLVEVPATANRLEPEDLASYLGLQAVARALDQGDTLEYWKSAPYLLNFMDEYQLKRALEKELEDPQRRAVLAKALAGRPGGLLAWRDVVQYVELDPGNARLRALIAATLDAGAWRLLWVPPVLPYYRLDGPFAEPPIRTFTKRLVFSSWRVVPRVIASLLSYEAERRMIRSFETAPENTPEARRRRTPLLRFARADMRLTGMPVLGFLYPSLTLARVGDPLSTFATGDTTQPPSAHDVIEDVRRRIETVLADLPAPTPGASLQEDESWYWAAPILLDLRSDPAGARDWFYRPELASIWSGTTTTPEAEEVPIWAEHVELARKLLSGPPRLGPRPADLSLVLAQVAIAGPGVTALRALSRVSGGSESLSQMPIRDAAAQVAWGFRNLFNTPEVMALIRGLNREEPYWRRCLEYSVAGCLQATLDEYVHGLRESLGLLDTPSAMAASKLAQVIGSALSLRAVTLGVDDLQVDAAANSLVIEPRRMRARFALRLAAEKAEDSDEETRADQVRQAFNSPFWPLILATTSVGQEGLDFHPYCHAVVHWNLPSNPVDLEQREGRVHRYKGHAVRRNLAMHLGHTLRGFQGADPWQSLFDKAQHERSQGTSDLVPFWVYPLSGGAKIERHVPALPLSRDRERLEALRRSLAVYRMIFGQPRQEDLMAYLLNHFSAEELGTIRDQLRINLSPPHDRPPGE